MPGWQAIYDELKAQNFQLVAVAQDTGGSAAADRHYQRAQATFTALVDEQHVVSTLYHMQNVPTGVWIDEQGRIARPPEVAYTVKTVIGQEVGGDRYVAALRDWVRSGAESPFVLPPAELSKRIAPRSSELQRADVCFRLGVHFHGAGNRELAAKYWSEAQRLNPDQWNYHRQDWVFTPGASLSNFMRKVRELKGRPYYAPLDLPPVAAESPKSDQKP